MTASPADVAVLMVAYNTAAYMGDSLRSLQEQRGNLRQQVIVVDNGSKDDSVNMIRTGFPDVKLIEAKANLGFARGVNLAASHADAEFLVLLNPDTLVLDCAIERLAEFARKHPDHGIYGGRAVRRDGSLEPTSCFALPTVWSMTCFALGLTTVFRNSRLFNPEAIPGWNRDTVREVGMVSGCLLLVRQDLWRRIGGFDERYFMYSEDADLACRLRDIGYRAVVFPEACIVHDLGKASATRADKLLLVLRGRATYLRKHFKGWRRSFVLTALVTGVGMRALLSRAAVLLGSKPNSWQIVWPKRKDWVKGYD